MTCWHGHHQLFFPGRFDDDAVAHFVGHRETRVIQVIMQAFELLGQRNLEQPYFHFRVFLAATRQKSRQARRRNAIR